MIKTLPRKLLSIVERQAVRFYRRDNAHGIVFILGLPRSGTTLVYQTLVHGMRWAYLSSLVDTRWQWPILATRFAKRKIREYESSFTSKHGSTEELAGPAEARDLWAHSLGWYYTDEPLGAERAQEMKDVVNAVSNILDAPFLSKSPDHCLHIRKLRDAFPEAVYIRVRRDKTETARSILHARLDIDTNWFGVKPPGWEEQQSKPLPDQSFFQVDVLDEMVDRGFADSLDPKRTMSVEYSEFCEDPSRIVKEIDSFLKANGISLVSNHSVPKQFKRSSGKPFSDVLEQEFVQLEQRRSTAENH